MKIAPGPQIYRMSFNLLMCPGYTAVNCVQIVEKYQPKTRVCRGTESKLRFTEWFLDVAKFSLNIKQEKGEKTYLAKQHVG